MHVLIFIAAIAALKLAAPLFIPFALAMFFFLLLLPVMSAMCRTGLPRFAAAAVSVLTLFGLLAFLAYLSAGPAAKWLEELPALVPSVQAKLEPVSEPMAKIEAAASEVEKLADVDDEPASTKVRVEEQSAVSSLLDQASYFATLLVVTIFLTFFLLTYSEQLEQRIANLGRTFGERRRLLRIGRQLQVQISRFLGTITLINIVLGVVAGFIFYQLDVPNYWMWGGVVAFANFVPYLGAVTMTVVMSAVAIVSFDTLAQAAMVPLLYLLLTIIEGQLVTPILVGHRLDLNPLVIFIAVIFWTYMWGFVGALVAVPIIASSRIILSNIPATQPVARLLAK